VFAATTLDREAQPDLQWYLEVYPAQYTTEPDDERAAMMLGVRRLASHG
jgi:hypothetical protein